MTGVKHFDEVKLSTRGLVHHEQWFETKIIDNSEKIIMPWAFHKSFPEKDKVKACHVIIL